MSETRLIALRDTFAAGLEMLEACLHPPRSESVRMSGKPEGSPPRGRVIRPHELAKLERAAKCPGDLVRRWETDKRKEFTNPYEMNQATKKEDRTMRAQLRNVGM